MIVLVFLVLEGLTLTVDGVEGSFKIPMREVQASEILDKIQNGESVEYDHVIVKGDLDLSQLHLQTNITSPIRIKDSVLDGSVNFNDIILVEPIDMSGSNFIKDTYFGGATFNGDAYFGGATFGGDAYFGKAKFRRVASFGGAKFGSFADFMGAKFSSFADFSKTTFGEDVNFMWTEFIWGAYFGFATFNGDAHFGLAKFSQDAYFGVVEFDGDADFEQATFSGDTNFMNVTFSAKADFEYTQFINEIEFGFVEFKNMTNFYRILFKRSAYFEDSSINSLNLTKADYSRLYLHWDNIKSLDFDEGAYLALIKNYNTLGWYNDENECYYNYRNAVKKNWLTSSAPNFVIKISNILNWFIDTIECFLYGYGVKPLFPIVWSVIFILAFGLLFRQKNCLIKLISKKSIKESIDEPDEVLINSITRKAHMTFIDPFLFSLLTFTSGVTSFLQPSVEYELEHHNRWAIVERLLGSFFVALFITAISKTYLIR